MSKTKFDKLIEYVIADDTEKARSLFHQIVVDKSRKIYEALDIDDTERAFDDVEADHTAAGESEDELGGDESDDLETDVFADDEGAGFGDEGLGEEGDEAELNPELDDRVADLESEFDTLKAEFEELLHAEEGGAEGEEEGGFEEEEGLEGLDSAVDDEGGEEDVEGEDETEGEFGGDDEGEEKEEKEEDEEEKEEPVDESVIREYVDRVTAGLSNETEEGFVQKTSPIKAQPSLASGVSAKNLNKGGTSQGRPNPTSKELTTDKIQNRPGGKAGVKSLTAAPKPVTKEEPTVNKKSVEA
jgi:hypothetical protein